MKEGIDEKISEFLTSLVGGAIRLADLSENPVEFLEKKQRKTKDFEEDEFYDNYFHNYIYQTYRYPPETEEYKNLFCKKINSPFQTATL